MATTSNFGKYVLLRKLASGGMGEVFLAKERGPRGFEKLLVIKRILSHHLDKPDYVEMFFSEAKLVARLNHHNIIQIQEMGEIQGDHYIAMEYVRGKSLRDIIDALRATGHQLPLAHVIELGVKLCEGLGYAHHARDRQGRSMDIIHRDVNPHNVLVSYNGDLKIIDFGIAKSSMTSVHTATGTIKGKFVYMSPEQSAADPIDQRSDIFSLGIVIYELACLENPFVRQNVVLSLEAIQRHDVPMPSKRRPDASPLDAIIQRALAKSADDRFQSAFELRDALRDLFRDAVVRPADQDLAGLLQTLFADDIHRDEELLAAAEEELDASGEEEVLRMTSAELIASPVEPGRGQVAFDEDEPTVSGDFGSLAALSRQVSRREPPSDLPRVSGPSDPFEPISLNAPILPEIRSASADSAPDRPAEWAREAGSEARYSPADPADERSADAEPFVRAVSYTTPPGAYPGHVVFPPARPASASANDSAMLAEPLLRGAHVVEESPLEETLGPLQHSDFVAPLSSVRPAMRAGTWRIAAYLGVLVATTVAGFVVTRFVLDRQSEPTGGRPRAAAKPAPAPRRVSSSAALARTRVAARAPTPAKSPPKSTPAAASEASARPAPARARGTPDERRPSSTRPPDPQRAAAPPRGPASQDERPAPRAYQIRAKSLGRLTLRTNQRVTMTHGAGEAQTPPAVVSIRRSTGTVVIEGPQLDYALTLSYRVTSEGLAVKVDAKPWVIVQHDGLSLGKTPQGPVAAGHRHRLTMLRPGQDGPFTVSLSWKPSS